MCSKLLLVKTTNQTNSITLRNVQNPLKYTVFLLIRCYIKKSMLYIRLSNILVKKHCNDIYSNRLDDTVTELNNGNNVDILPLSALQFITRRLQCHFCSKF